MVVAQGLFTKRHISDISPSHGENDRNDPCKFRFQAVVKNSKQGVKIANYRFSIGQRESNRVKTAWTFQYSKAGVTFRAVGRQVRHKQDRP